MRTRQDTPNCRNRGCRRNTKYELITLIFFAEVFFRIHELSTDISSKQISSIK